jgi:uncharacterized membrane protein YphA (DoxX/SURF4 family)
MVDAAGGFIMHGLFIAGRALFGGFFTYSGLNHLVHHQQLSAHAASRGVGSPDAAVASSGVLLLASGLSVLAGVKPRLGLAGIIGFLVPVSLAMHRFWETDDPQRQMQERVHFMKNAALAGAALMLMQVAQPWPASVDSLRRDEEMYVRLGALDLRALPA